MSVKKNHKWRRQNIFIFLGFCFLFSGLSIAYGALSTELMIAGSVMVDIEYDVEIKKVDFIDNNCGVLTYQPTNNSKSITLEGNLPALNCTATFDVTVINKTTQTYGIKTIQEDVFNNSNIQYTFSDNNMIGYPLPAGSETNFQVTFSYKNTLSALPSKTDFGLILRFDFQEYVQPLLLVSDNYRNYEMYTRQSLDLDPKLSALDDFAGNITNKITKTCKFDGGSVACPTNFNLQNYGQWQVTYDVANRAGQHATPVTIGVLVWGIVKIEEGDYHTIALSSHGKLWTWGWGADYRLGSGTSNQWSPVQRTNLIPKIVDFTTGQASSIALDVNGNIWVWGVNSNYALGDNTTTTRQTPTKVTPPNGVKFVQVSEFYQTGAALTDTGDVYVWGNTSYGASGRGDVSNTQTPTRLNNIPKMKKVAMGAYNGAAIAENGDLYMWGSNNEDQLGTGFTGAGTSPTGASVTTFNNLPKKYINLANVKSVAIGNYHVAAVLEDGSVYTWGRADYGRLCNNSTGTAQRSPYRVTQITNGATAVVNVYNTIFTTTNGRAYACGGGNYGETQNGNTNDALTPHMNTQYSNVKHASFGIDTSHILTADSQVIGYGYGGNGERGCGTSYGSSPTPCTWNFTVPPMTMW